MLCMDFSDVLFDADLHNVLEALKFELSCILDLPGRNMRLNQLSSTDKLVRVRLDIAQNDPAVEDLPCDDIQNICTKLQDIIRMQDTHIIGSVWARKIFNISLLSSSSTFLSM